MQSQQEQLSLSLVETGDFVIQQYLALGDSFLQGFQSLEQRAPHADQKFQDQVVEGLKEAKTSDLTQLMLKLGIPNTQHQEVLSQIQNVANKFATVGLTSQNTSVLEVNNPQGQNDIDGSKNKQGSEKQ